MTLVDLSKKCREELGLTEAEWIQMLATCKGGVRGQLVFLVAEATGASSPNVDRDTLRALVLKMGMSPAAALGLCPECGADVEGEGDHRAACAAA